MCVCVSLFLSVGGTFFFLFTQMESYCSAICFFHLTVIALAIFQQDPGWNRERQKGCESPEKERCVCVLGVAGRSPHRSLHTVGEKPGREAPIISSQRTVVCL